MANGQIQGRAIPTGLEDGCQHTPMGTLTLFKPVMNTKTYSQVPTHRPLCLYRAQEIQVNCQEI